MGQRKNIEGLGSDEHPPNWTVIDLGNIVVHTMEENIREKYDLGNGFQILKSFFLKQFLSKISIFC